MKYVLSSFFNSYYLLLPLNFITFWYYNFEISIVLGTFIYIFIELLIFYLIILFLLKNYKKPLNQSVAKHEQFPLDKMNSISFNKDYLASIGINQKIIEFFSKNNLIDSNSLYLEKNEVYNLKNVIFLESRINDCNNCNVLFKEKYDELVDGGYLIISFNNIEQTNILLKKKYKIFTPLIYPFHWIFYRLFSKIPYLDSFQNFITNHKNKVMSWVEVYGRLSFSGFDVLDEISIEDKQFIIAKKVRTISTNPNPSYYLVVNLNRVTLFGNITKVKKVRSMYPYSEFLQKRIFETNNLSNSGKFDNDPRITPAGTVIRKYWIDELPQVLEIIRGKIKLVGIRAMSQHYFSLYNNEYQELYYQTKPGFLSPLFDDNGNFNHIQDVEMEYLKKYSKAPFKTDVEYLFKTIKQIFKGIRSK